MLGFEVEEEEGGFDDQFDALINFDGEGFGGDAWAGVLEEGVGMHGESGGFMVDMDWMKEGGVGEVFGWTAGSPGVPVKGEETGMGGMGMGMGLSEEERAVFLLRERAEVGGN